MNKSHIAGTGVGAGFVALGINLFFPHLQLTPDQTAYLVGALPAVAMGLLAAIEVIFPKSKAVIDAIETAAATGVVPHA